MQKNNDLENSQLMEALAATNEAKGVYKRHVLFKVVGTVVLVLISFLLVSMMSLSLASEEGVFTVGVADPPPETILSLSTQSDMSDSRTYLSFENHGVLDNIDGRDLPEDLDEYDGDHSGKNYLCYSFYLQNSGIATVDITAQILVSNVTKGTDEAVRIKIYDDGNPNIYAKAAKNGEAEPDTIMWTSPEMAYEVKYQLDPTEIKKYTIVVWLEGNDPECINDILGGFVQLEMTFLGESIKE